jgi:antitoxin component YwqK of YwqJK toxin-antitoxin module
LKIIGIQNLVNFCFIFLLFLFLLGCTGENISVSDLNKSENKSMQVGDNSLNDLNFSVDHEASKKNGVITEYYEDGAKMSEITYEQGAKNGISKSWFSNGQLKEERGYVNDRFHGAYRVWAKTGLPRISGFYSNGKQHGEWILYDQEGKPMPSVYYDDGVEVTRVLPSLRD